MVSIPEVPLRSPPANNTGNDSTASASANNSIPLVGFGTASWPFGESGEILKESILTAIELGYRHFDTAAVYQSEQCLGEAVSQALDLGLVKSRDELFITSKLWCSDVHPSRVLPALRNTLQKLGLEYLDLYLIHFPISMKPAAGYVLPFSQSDLLPMDFKSVWEAMEECHKLGLTKNIGVSNFSSKKLKQLLLTANIPPAVNQVEMNPLWQQKKLRKFCEEKGIHVTAYSPLGAKGTLWGTDQVMECEILKEIAKSKGKTLAQVCLRWVYEQGVSALVKSFNKERMRQNLEILGWTLNPEESQKINQIPQQKGCRGLEFVSDGGPYKSVEDLWDEPIDLNVTG
ncbi:non-functional NADPH-dependent codeinone reductase 2-like [Rhododendron vialii]|uniref:non-functional NADPH-dependent codeinone reductase 2-like n=1 Tax=Rhododendron vialii TaxID=182163 RepID=UPI00265F96CD|nr:non-functional NADPH-dependent codeinone reductase 2-like [Rhododendron vialii]